MTDDDEFFEKLRGDAASLRYRVDEATLARIRERIYERIAPAPTLTELLASWFRPLAATLATFALAAAISLAVNRNDASLGEQPVEIVMGGDTYVVGN
jgi:hypothetical protein